MSARVCPTCHSIRWCSCERTPAPEPAPVATPLFLWPTTPPSNGVETSDEAAAALTSERLDRYHRKILSTMNRQFRESGATREQLSEATGIDGDTLRPRVLELAAERWIGCRTPDGREIPIPARGEASEALRGTTRKGNGAHLLFLTARYVRAVEAVRVRTAGFLGREDAA